MRIAERLDGEREDEEEQRKRQEGKGGEDTTIGAGEGKKDRTLRRTKPLKSINILYRPLLHQRESSDREKRMRNDLQQSLTNLSHLPTYNESDLDLDTDDKTAGYGIRTPSISITSKQQQQEALIQEEELEEEDEELEAFNALEPKERLERLVRWLREEFRYCFWCKFRYEDGGMEGCPGVEEEDHD